MFNFPTIMQKNKMRHTQEKKQSALNIPFMQEERIVFKDPDGQEIYDLMCKNVNDILKRIKDYNESNFLMKFFKTILLQNPKHRNIIDGRSEYDMLELWRKIIKD